MTKTDFNKHARNDIEHATTYAKFAEEAVDQAKWWFDHRGPIEATNDFWGNSNVTRYEYAHKRFRELKREIATWRKLAVSNLNTARRMKALAATYR